MSGICGTVNFDGAPVDPELLKKMAEAAAYRGPDGITYWIEGNVGQAHLALHTTPESVREKQPLLNRRGDVIITTDARVDNRDELTRTLTAKGYLQEKDPTDADLILAAYECWGEECPEHIVGDFAFVIWDARHRCLLAARDRIGSRPFYYRSESGIFQWATEAVQLLADPAFPVRLNERMIARDLALPGYGGRHESYYLGVAKLGPAERLTADEHGVTLERYWDFDPDRKIRYASDDEYVEHFAELFRQAVRARLRSVRPVGLFMSGGVDSTSIAATAADELSRAPDGLAPGLHVVHWTVSRFPEFDESERSRAVAERWGFEYHEVLVDSLWPLCDYPQRLPHRDEPFSSHLYSFHTGYLKTLRDSSRPRVWMTGHPGDMVVGGDNPFYYLNLFRSARFRSLVGTLATHRQMYGIPAKQLVLQFFISPLFLQPSRQRWRTLRGHQPELPAWVAPDLAKRTDLVDWLSRQPSIQPVEGRPRVTEWADPAKDRRYRMLTFHQDVRIRIWFDRMAAVFGAEVWVPWDDIRLTEYILAIPEEQIVRGINHKLVLRRAMKSILPTAVRERRGLRTGTPLYIEEGLRTEEAGTKMDALLADSRAAALGFLNPNSLQQALAGFRSRQRRWFFALWMALSLEMWLRAHTS